MIIYADTSALVKVLLEESGSPEMVRLLEMVDGVVSVAISYVELRAALAAAIRDGRVPTAHWRFLNRAGMTSLKSSLVVRCSATGVTWQRA